MFAHDELIEDRLYSEGWRQVSFQDECRSKGCNCEATGQCSLPFFNHFMVRDYQQADAKRQAGTSFPICINTEMPEGLNMEEVRCMRHTTGAAHQYYLRNVTRGDDTMTMASVAAEEHKSTCFNVSCCLLEVPVHRVPPGALALGSGEEGIAWVLCRDISINTSVLESLCSIGVDPVVTASGQLSLSVLREGKGPATVLLDTSGFKCKEGGPNVLYDRSPGSIRVTCLPNAAGVRAVKTALVTVSILLTPKSMYGGKNPSTKLVTYFVHNIYHSENVLHV
jgi:hypothetical protein